MKPNFATFPNFYTDLKEINSYYRKLQEYRELVLEWRMNCVKEIRKIIKSCEDQPIQGHNMKVHLQSRIEAFKEILGDE